MAVKWTSEQQKVISLRDRNILVSAGAGSGKTAVLVQRILSKIMDREKPIDIDRLLIMTFTRAAAGEMRERILAALENALCEDPDNEHLQKQATLIHAAQITTIDGFCAYIIRNYFHLIDLDPGYRIADEGELKLLKEDVLKEILEEAYASNKPEFIHFVECYATGKNDDNIQGILLKIYDAAMSHPNPEEWLKQCIENYKINDFTKLEEQPWMGLLWEIVEQQLLGVKQLLCEAISICEESDGPEHYISALQDDFHLTEELQKIAKEKEYDDLYLNLYDLRFSRLSAKKMPDVSEEKKEKVKELREQIKEQIKELAAKYFLQNSMQLLQMFAKCQPVVETMVELVLEFTKRFAEKKREKNLLDFTDMEHFALKILMQNGGKEGSPAARELSEKYDEVLVDEYQDSNLVQELLTTCVSGWVQKRKNIFMVGDVKQSIYRFRLARPELFMEKYKTYTLEDSKEQRIDLHKNFRSRKEVLDSVNYIFRRIMGEDLGGITYDISEELHAGASFAKSEDPTFAETEILLIEKDSEEVQEETDAPAKMDWDLEALDSPKKEKSDEQYEKEAQNAREMEALAIAHSILSIVGKKEVVDKETGTYRPVRYGDIAVLLRSASGWAETFLQVFSSKGIPAYTASKTGYFSALEVVTVLNYLKICDNPLQDIPMTGVLRSPIVGLSAQEMAVIKSFYQDGYFYESIEALLEMAEIPEEKKMLISKEEYEALYEKLGHFMVVLKKMRKVSAYTPIHQLIQLVLKETGYGNYAKAMPGGLQRNANLHMLVEKAMDYERTSYRGLFNFIRYIEKLQRYEVDFGEVNLTEGENASVQIMTIHKSKGLEFPIVYAAGMGKQFNVQDMNASVLVHPDLGIGVDVILPEKRQILPGMLKQMLRRQLLKESLGEELRVLYVALTRAKEKLYITGTIGNLEKYLMNLLRLRGREEELLPIGTRMKAKTYWDYILSALAEHPCMEQLYEEYQLDYWKSPSSDSKEAKFHIHKMTAADLVMQETILQAENEMQKDALLQWDSETIYDAEIHEILERRFAYQYPFGYLKDIPIKVTVSELKKRNYVSFEEKEEAVTYETDFVPIVPKFISEEETYVGAARGTAYHRLMECLDYMQADSVKEVAMQILELVKQKKMERAEAECISVRDVWNFLESDIGKRMRAASKDGRLFREQPFVISVDASAADETWQQGEKILVQGIIDAYFVEDKQIVLVDYKTDRVRRGEEQKLIDLYHTQLKDYAKALERMLEMPVKEKYIYSFTLNKAILVE